MKKISLALMILIPLLFFNCIISEEEKKDGNIKGTVTLEYSESNSGVSVFLSNTGYSATTRSDGYYGMSKVPKGTYTIIFEKYGWISEEQEVIIRGGEDTTLDITLEREIPEPPDLPNP